MSRRGRKASLPGDAHHRPEVVAADGLVVEHRDRNGRTASYDFSTLPVAEPMQRSLAAVFAPHCRPAHWSSHDTSEQVWLTLRTFTGWLASLPDPPEDVDDITVAVWNAWKLSRDTASYGGYNQVRRVAGLLLEDARVVGPVAEAMARRLRRPAVREKSFEAEDFSRIKTAARRTFRSAHLRIQKNMLHLEQWKTGAFEAGGRDWLIGDALDCLARTGDVPSNPRAGGSRVQHKYATALGGHGAEATWQRLFLTRREAAALGVLLMAEFGLNLSVIDTLAVPRATPDSGPDGSPTYRLELVKFRRGPGRQHETRNVTDFGAASSGRLITQALEATRPARVAVEAMAPGTDRLIVWRTTMRGRGEGVGEWFRFGVTEGAGRLWATEQGLSGAVFRRGRRTVNVVERREPGQNSQDTHDRVYVLPDHQAIAAAAPVVAAAAEAARQHAQRAVLAAELRDKPEPGDVPTATADCHDFDHGPIQAADGGCGASFLACLGCTNARVHPGHHSRLAHLHHALTNLRSAMHPGLWQSDWGDSHARLEHLRKHLGPPAWDKALREVTEDDRALIDDLLTGVLDS
ncbi:hypothetical protein ACFY97_02655 [Streptomyces klenkii]|uniref:hypothetical protein n=1 Tax=Streptomyces klenkii TaxID=1420899 RepID=UPI0036F0A940